jgi:hypothetical protein
MIRVSLALVASLFAGAAGAAGSCDAILAEIDMKIRAAGVSRFTLTTVDAAEANINGKVVGSCDLGTKKIVYSQQGESPASSPRPRSEPILTEGKDGSTTVGGGCRQ